MNKLEYLLKLKSDPIKIYYTWKSLGGLTVDNKTRMYVKDNLFKVTEEGPMCGAYVFCIYEYAINTSKGFGPIDWSNLTVDELDSRCYFYQGVESPNFRVILTPEEAKSIAFPPRPSDPTGDSSSDWQDPSIVPEDFVPFADSNEEDPSTSSGIIISDDEYLLIMGELGMPFLREDELEYNKSTIIRICIKPALDQYYAYFPLVIDENLGPTSSGRQWKVEYHLFDTNKTAIPYKADAYMTLGSGSSTASSYSTAFNFMRTELMGMGSMGGGYQWGNGLRYRKAVPGYVGLENSDAALMGLATRQGYLNSFRREYSRDVIENGKKYVQGYTSIGGCLNIHWLCMDLDYSHIPYWDLPTVRKLCTSYALRNIGALRGLLKSNENIPFDTEKMTSRADELEKEVLEGWKENTLPFALAMNRGGL